MIEREDAHMGSIDSSTRQRLLTAAAQVFDESGFAGASVREICARAEANIAAINYHFGGKEQLFTEVLRLPIRTLEESIPAFADPALPLREALVQMFAGMLKPLHEGSAEAAAMRLTARSFAAADEDGPRPDPAVIGRHHAALIALVRRHLPVAIDDATVQAVCGALVGMAMHAVMGGLRPGPIPRMLDRADAAGVAALAARLARYGAAIIATEAAP